MNTKAKRGVILLIAAMLSMNLAACTATDKETTKSTGTQTEVVVENINVVEVSTTEEFLNAIKPDTTIKVKPGTYDLLSVDFDSDYVRMDETYDGVELIVSKVNNLKIVGDENEKPLFEISPRYSNVMTFKDCDNVTISNIVAGHTPQGECVGGVLKFVFCDDAVLNNLDLYGCGTVGIYLSESTNFDINNPNIYDCSYEGIVIEGSRNISIKGGKLHDNMVIDQLIRVENSANIEFEGTEFSNNKQYEGEFYYTSFVDNRSRGSIRFIDCTIKNNDMDYFSSYQDMFSNCLVVDNTFFVDTNEQGIYNNTYEKKEESWYELKIKEATDWLLSTETTDKNAILQKATQKYQKLTEELGYYDLEGIPTALKTYKSLSEMTKDKEINDNLYMIFVGYYDKCVSNALFNLFNYDEIEKISYFDGERYSFVELSKIDDPYLKNRVQYAIKSGITLSNSQMGTSASELSNFLVSNASDTVSEGMNAYLTLRAEEVEIEEIYMGEYGFYNTVANNEFSGKRLIAWSELLKKYPKFKELENGTVYYDMYLESFTTPLRKMTYSGVDYSTIEDYSNFMISSDEMRTMEYFVKILPNLPESKEVSKLIGIIKNDESFITVNAKEGLLKLGILEKDKNYDAFFKQSANMKKVVDGYIQELKKYKSEVKNLRNHDIDTSDTKVVKVNNALELFEAIGPNKHIIVKPGVYSLYGYTIGYNAEGEMNNTLNNIENLTIECEGDEPAFMMFDYATVLTLNNCNNIVLKNLILGHSTNYCNGNVVELNNSENIHIVDSLLFGSGYIGVKMLDSKNVSVDRCMITDTTENPITILNSTGTRITSTRVYDNKVDSLIMIDGSKDTILENSQMIYNNPLNKDSGDHFMFDIQNSDEIVIKDSYFIDNSDYKIFSDEVKDKIEFTNNITN